MSRLWDHGARSGERTNAASASVSSSELVLLGSCALVLLGAVVLPVAGERWSPWVMAQGYEAAGKEFSGPHVTVFHLAPHLVGLIVLVGLLARDRSPAVSTVGVVGLATVWLGGAAAYWAEFVGAPALRAPAGWLFFGILSVGAVVIPLVAHGGQRGVRVDRVGLALALASLFAQVGIAVFSVVEDRLWLGCGAWIGCGAALGCVLVVWRRVTSSNRA